MQKRIYGKQNEKISIVGFGGIIVSKTKQTDANDYVSEALDNGVNYFDVAPTYGDAEDKLGPALKGKRNHVFLACKTEMRTAKEAESAFYRSLKKLETDCFDLYQMHSVTTMEDVETITGPYGCLEFFEKAKKEGLIRHIGFSAHSETAAYELMDRYDFDSILFPYNCVNINTSKFGAGIYDRAAQKGITKLALKAMALRKLIEGETRKYSKPWYMAIEDEKLAKLALRYTLSRDITAAIPPGEMGLFRIAVEAVQDFKPLSDEEEKILEDMSFGLDPIF